MSVTPIFPGFSEPTENYFRLPNNWFESLNRMRTAHGDRIAAPVKMLEYILKYTWGLGRFDGSVCLSADEIRNGRHGRNRQRLDKGTGLSENAIHDAGLVLEELGFIYMTQDTKDLARRMRTYTVRLAESDDEVTALDNFHGFNNPKDNYFKVAKEWTDLTRSIIGAATIVTTEYLFRYAWGYNNGLGTWMTADEIANGRIYVLSGKRYDSGTGFSLNTIRRALNDAITLKFVMFRDIYENGINTREFNLRLASSNVDEDGRFSETPIITNEVVTATTEVIIPENQAQAILTNEDVNITNEVVNITNEVVVLANEARSVKDTTQDTSKRNKEKTPSSDELSKEVLKRIDVDVVPLSLPKSILEGLKLLKWTNNLNEVCKIYASNPELVKAWMGFKLNTRRDPKINYAGMFLVGIRSGKMPPYTFNYNDDYISWWFKPDYEEPEPELEEAVESDLPEHVDSVVTFPDVTKSIETQCLPEDLEPKPALVKIIEVPQAIVAKAPQRMARLQNALFEHLKKELQSNFFSNCVKEISPNHQGVISITATKAEYCDALTRGYKLTVEEILNKLKILNELPIDPVSVQFVPPLQDDESCKFSPPALW